MQGDGFLGDIMGNHNSFIGIQMIQIIDYAGRIGHVGFDCLAVLTRVRVIDLDALSEIGKRHPVSSQGDTIRRLLVLFSFAAILHSSFSLSCRPTF